jgi:hypothetical protein
MEYKIVLGNDELEQYTFSYELNNDNPTKVWSDLVKHTVPNDLRKSLNPWRGVSSNYNASVKQLNDVIDELNAWMPNKIENKWQLDEPTKSLNLLHVHFPELEKGEIDSTKRDQLTRFNDLIHGLQVILHNKPNAELLYILLCCDNTNQVKIDEQDFKFFKPYVNFGDLTLHYCHVGRHPLELLLSNDTDCPKDQVIPQYNYSAFHTLRFFTISDCLQKFKKFYHESNISWPYDLNDTRLALGYINLGKLRTVNNKQYTNQDISSIVKSCNKILDWQII